MSAGIIEEMFGLVMGLRQSESASRYLDSLAFQGPKRNIRDKLPKKRSLNHRAHAE